MDAHADIAGRGHRVVENAVATIDCRSHRTSSSSRCRPPGPVRELRMNPLLV